MTDIMRCPVCRGEEGHIRFITTEVMAEYVGPDDARIIPGTAGWVGGTEEPTARIDIAGDCGHNWSMLIRQSDLRVRYRVYQDEQKPSGPFMPRRQPNGGQMAVNREEVVPDSRGSQKTDKTEAPVNDAGADALDEDKKSKARERMLALWAQARAEGRERPGGPIVRLPAKTEEEKL